MSKHVGEKCGKWADGDRTDGESDGRTENPEGDPDGHHHTIIRPVWRRAYKNADFHREPSQNYIPSGKLTWSHIPSSCPKQTQSVSWAYVIPLHSKINIRPRELHFHKTTCTKCSSWQGLLMPHSGLCPWPIFHTWGTIFSKKLISMYLSAQQLYVRYQIHTKCSSSFRQD